MNDLAEKVKASVERMKAFEPPEGYMLAFSGGKDSVVLKALADMAGVKYQAHYNVTSVDPPELIYFIREKYQDVEWEYPRYDDGEHFVYCQDIDEAPTVDAVLVVRCRECKHMRRDNVGVFCKVWNGYNGCGVDGFCSYGEKRET